MTDEKGYIAMNFFDNIKRKHLKEFNDIKTPEGNFISGFICKKANHFLGSMVITKITLKDGTEIETEQFIQSMPKIHYFDKYNQMADGGEVKYSAYEKLDGSCLILYGLYDNEKNLIEIVPKTRGIPVADSHVLEMYNEIDHCNIDCFFETFNPENPTLMFELYGTLNMHTIYYPEVRIDLRLIGATSEGVFLDDFELDWLLKQYDFKRPYRIFNLLYYNNTWKIRIVSPGIYFYYLFKDLSEVEKEELLNEEFPTQFDAIQGIKERITRINKKYFEVYKRSLLEGVVLDTVNSYTSNFMFLKIKSADIEEKCRTENGIPRKFILKEVHKYFDEYGSKAKELYREDPEHVIEYVNRNLLEEFDAEAVQMKRTQSRIKNVFLDMLEAKEPPKGLQEICHRLVEEYPGLEISDMMRLFAQNYPEKKRYASMVFSIFESIL